MKETRKRFYVYSISIFIVFSICLSIIYTYNLWKTNRGYIESSYNILLDTKTNRIKEIVNNAIKSVDQQRQIIEKDYKNYFDMVVASVKDGPGNDEAIEWIKKLSKEYSFCSFTLWDDKKAKLLFTTEKSPIESSSKFLREVENSVFSDMVGVKGYSIGIAISKDVIETEVTNGVRKLFHSYVLDSEGYIWVNKILDYNGGEDYAIRLIHPSLVETEGQMLSTETQDIMGNRPYLEELNGIKKDGEILFTYYFKKKNSEIISHKMTYAKLYPNFNWVVATGVYLDDIENFVKTENEKINNSIWDRLITFSLMMIGFIVTMAFIMYLLERHYTRSSQSQYISIKNEKEKLESIAFKDSLTKLYNRRGMESYLNESFKVFQLSKAPMWVIMGDVDDFKKINDAYGHHVGDKVLMVVSKAIQSALRNTDVACRWGGEEFLIALPAAKSEVAVTIVERIRGGIAAEKIHINDTYISVTCSFGVSKFYDDDEGYAPSMIRADKALYESKIKGKNKATIFVEAE